MPRVFLSYARADGEVRAAEIRERLGREASDIVIWQDHLFLEGGVGWWKQVTDAIDSVEFLVLMMTPGAIASGNVEREWRYARQQGVCVYPIKGAPDAELDFARMPRWMSKAHFFDLDAEWLTFVAHLRKGCDRRRVPFMAPDLPPHFVERPGEYEALKNLLLTADRGGPVAITTALAGAGGFGKTTLAAALCHDEDIVENFDDGILWVTLGQTPDVLGTLLTAYAAVTGERPGFASEADAAFQLGQKLEQRTCLIVIDDVWDAAHLRPFLRGGKASARLFTTRDANIASVANPVNVDEMREVEAVAMLSKSVPSLDTVAARDLARRLGEWPLALELAAAMMRERVRLGDSAGGAAARLVTIIERRGVRALQDPTATERRHRTVSSVLEVSLELLDAEDRRCLTELSIFPEDVAIPLGAAASVWRLDELDAEDLAQRLARLSLLKLDLQHGAMRLHDVMRSWLAGELGDARQIHDRLVKAWPDWRELPDEYASRWLPWHLVQAERKEDLRRILCDPQWMVPKLEATDINALIADYEYLKPSAEMELIQGALRLSSHVLAADTEQFAGQMAGRLLLDGTPAIQRFIGEVIATASACWLRPLHPTLSPPGTELVRTLEGQSSVNGVADDNTLSVWDLDTGRVLRTLKGHSTNVSSVAVTPDGKRAVSASQDNTLRVWDLETGRALRKLVGHSSFVLGVAVISEGKRAVSASADKTLKLWNLKTGRALRTLEGHSSFVFGVAVTLDGKRAVSASGDNTLKVWDLKTGGTLRTLEGHTGNVNGVAVTPDGMWAVSASEDETLRVWDLETGSALRILEGHTAYVNGVAVTLDGKRAVSASGDNTLKVWDLKTGRTVQTLEGHSSCVSGAAVTADGKRAVSACFDKTLKVWDLETGHALRKERQAAAFTGVAATAKGKLVVSACFDKTLKMWDLDTGCAVRTLEGHSSSVSGVAVTQDGKLAVSGSADRTVRVWNLETGGALRTLEGPSSVLGVAVAPDGKRAVSACFDKTLTVWDLQTGRALHTLEGHSHSVYGVAVTPEGGRAISASWDKTLKVWDLETGGALRTLEGHSSGVNAVAVTPDGKRAVSVSNDHTPIVWDLETGRALRTLKGHSAGVRDVAVTADGRRVVSASYDKTIKVWDLETGLPLATFHCDAGATCCAFAGGQTIVVGDAGGRLHFLRLEERR